MESYINLDKNMLVNTTIGDAEVVWHDVRKKPFSLHGFLCSGDENTKKVLTLRLILITLL